MSLAHSGTDFQHGIMVKREKKRSRPALKPDTSKELSDVYLNPDMAHEVGEHGSRLHT